MFDFKIYIPIEKENISCVSVLDHNTLRVYDNIPDFNSSSTYTDFYIDSHYLSKVGVETFSESIPGCISSDLITNDFYYRQDFDSILFVFIVLMFFMFLVPFKIFTKLFRRLK